MGELITYAQGLQRLIKKTETEYEHKHEDIYVSDLYEVAYQQRVKQQAELLEQRHEHLLKIQQAAASITVVPTLRDQLVQLKQACEHVDRAMAKVSVAMETCRYLLDVFADQLVGEETHE